MNRKYFSCIILFALFLCPFSSAVAQNSMTDEQVYKMMLKEQKSGATRQEIVTKLMENGVSIEQIRRIAKKHKNDANQDLLDSRDITGSKKRTRVNNGDKREMQHGQKKRIYDTRKFDSEDYDDLRKRQMKEYDDELLYLFPDSLSMYGYWDEDEDKPKVFGRDIFNNKNLTFESSMNIATPTDYHLGPGDDVFIDIYGASQKRIEGTISPEGTIDIDNYGPVSIGGLTVSQATARLKSNLGARYAGSNIRLTVGQTKTISIQVMGAVKVPGTYTVSAFATVFHALYMAGGTNDIGTLRDIKVFRNGKQISSVDIYDYLLNGKLTGNVKLSDNDIIIVGPYDCLVNIAGKVKRPMFYEMKKGESVETLLNYAGGFAGDAYKNTLRLIRKNGDRYSIFTIDEFERPNFKVMDGDSVSVDSVLAKFDNMVVIKGAVMRPGMYEIGKEIHSVRELLVKAQGLTPKAFGQHAVMHRKKKDESYTTIALNLDAILKNEAPDVALQNEDVIYVMSTEDHQEEQKITIYGEVMYPGEYTFSENTTIEDFIIQAGGLTDAASLAKVDVSRRIKNKDALNSSDVLAETFSFTLKDGFVISKDSSFFLQPFDEVYVRKSPGYIVQKHVTISGEIAFPGEYTITKNDERLSDIIKRAGGLTQNSYAKGAQLQRVLTPEEKVKQRSLLKIISSSDSIDINKVELGDTYSVGIHLDKAIENEGNDTWDIVLEEGDQIIIPQYRYTVTINGEVMYPTTLAFKNGANLKYYIDHSGGFSSNAKKTQIFAINMNGTINKIRNSKDIQPGCEIIIPSKKKQNRMTMGEMVSLGTMTASLASIIAILLK